MALPLDSTLALLSGIPLVLLGAWLLALTPRRSDQVFFGLFAVLWGSQVVTANLGLVLDSAAVFRTSFLVTLAITPVATLFLGQFAVSISPARWARVLPWGLGTLAVITAGVLLVRPELLLESVASQDGGLGPVQLGSLAFPLVSIPFFATFYLVLLLAYRRYRSARLGSQRHRYRGIVLALALYTSYETVTNISTFVFGHPGVQEPAFALLAQGTFVAGAVILGGLVTALIVSPPEHEDRDRGLIAAFLIPAAVALLTETIGPLSTSFRSWGLWRILSVAVLVHAIARYQLFDLDLRLKRIAGPGIAASLAALGAVIGLVSALGDQGPLAAGLPVAIGVVGGGLVTSQRDRIAQRLFPAASQDAGYLRQRKLEVYQAALERFLADGHQDPSEEGILRDLRESLGIDQDQHDALLARLALTGQGTAASVGERVRPGALVAGHYRIDRAIGQGAHGCTYRAYDETLDDEVAIKVVGGLTGRTASLLQREAQLLAGVEHDHVIELRDVLELPHETALVMAYAPGGSLRDLLRRRGRLGVHDAIGRVDEALDGLGALHDAGIIHRDVKPENLLLGDQGQVLVADLGIALSQGPDVTAMTAGPAGTLLYMSPEQVRGQPATPATDTYAMGIVLYELLTGRAYLPTAGRDDFQVRQAILDEPPRLDRLPAEAGRLVPVLKKALAKDPEDRFQRAEDLQAALSTRQAVPVAP